MNESQKSMHIIDKNRASKSTSEHIAKARHGYFKNSYLQSILEARVYDVADDTPLQKAPSLTSRLQCKDILLKREDLQPVFSFKIRGAYNKMSSLMDSPDPTVRQKVRKNGIVACSAGNHAQGVALAAQKLGIPAIIVMPVGTPNIKVDSVRKWGSSSSHHHNSEISNDTSDQKEEGLVQVKLAGESYDEASQEAMRLVKEKDMILIHPFDDPMVIAGQGTIAAEILRERTGKPLDAIFVCCGGGGLLAGIGAYVKHVRPEVKVIGVEAEDAAGMTHSLQEGRVVTLPTVGLFADGASVRRVGTETFRVCHETVDQMITVNTDEICQDIQSCSNEAFHIETKGIENNYNESNNITHHGKTNFVHGSVAEKEKIKKEMNPSTQSAESQRQPSSTQFIIITDDEDSMDEYDGESEEEVGEEEMKEKEEGIVQKREHVRNYFSEQDESVSGSDTESETQHTDNETLQTTMSKAKVVSKVGPSTSHEGYQNEVGTDSQRTHRTQKDACNTQNGTSDTQKDKCNTQNGATEENAICLSSDEESTTCDQTGKCQKHDHVRGQNQIVIDENIYEANNTSVDEIINDASDDVIILEVPPPQPQHYGSSEANGSSIRSSKTDRQRHRLRRRREKRARKFLESQKRDVL
eukprot:g709.t1